MPVNIKPRSKFLIKLLAGSKSFFAFSGIFLFFMLLVGVLEIALAGTSHSLENNIFELIGLSWLHSFLLFFSILFPAFIAYLLLFLLSKGVARIVISSLIVLFFIIQLLLLYYYNTTLLMLGSDLFGYSIDEISQTVGASGSIALVPFLIFIGFISALIFILVKIPKRISLPSLAGFILPLLSLLFIISGFSKNMELGLPDSNFEKGLVNNKSVHFYEAVYSYFNPEQYETDIYADDYLADYLSGFDGEVVEYIDEQNFPFLHTENKRDVLTPFLETRSKSPNIVLILVEGLGRAFTNKGAYLGNFTPFLDSLSTKSLYWPNFLSSGGRTFAVLPSLLGSLPFGETGFMEMENMPDELSLVNLLKKNGYQTSFYYGGESRFDNMEGYLKRNHIDKIMDGSGFPQSYKKIPASATGFSWGYGDKELFRYYLASNEDDTLGKPSFNVILTVSTHSPFLTSEPEKYSRKFEEIMDSFGFDKEKKARYRDFQKQYSSVLFTDDALKSFFSTYEKRNDFENTIFIITGDHRIPEIPMTSKIDRYHVPLIIYSPLLKRTAKMEAISSHFDVAPSLIEYLKNNFDIKVPSENSFVGEGLDTTRSFQNIHKIPLKQTKTELVDFVMGEYHLNGEQLFKLQPDLGEDPIDNPEKKMELLNAFNQFRRRNAEIISGKEIIPDSIVKKYTN